MLYLKTVIELRFPEILAFPFLFHKKVKERNVNSESDICPVPFFTPTKCPAGAFTVINTTPDGRNIKKHDITAPQRSTFLKGKSGNNIFFFPVIWMHPMHFDCKTDRKTTATTSSQDGKNTICAPPFIYAISSL